MYINFLFVNGIVFVFIYDEQYDIIVFCIYEEVLFGYNIVGIDCNGIIFSFGVIYCIIKLVGVNDLLWIVYVCL